MNDLSGFSKALEEMSQRKEAERVAFNEKLGEPAAFVGDETDGPFGTGYWKAEGGVISYRRHCNGYDPLSRVEYPDALIDLLVRVRS